MRHITLEGLDLIKRFEGFSSTIYICPAGYKTIGYGHLVRSHERFKLITEQQAEALLKRDVEIKKRRRIRRASCFTINQSITHRWPV